MAPPSKKTNYVFICLVLLTIAAWGGWFLLAKAEDTRVGLSDSEWVFRTLGWIAPFGLGLIAILSRWGNNTTLRSNYFILLAPVVGAIGSIFSAIGSLRGSLTGLSSYTEHGHFITKDQDHDIHGQDRIPLAVLFLVTGFCTIPAYYFGFRTQGLDLLKQFGVSEETFEPWIDGPAILVDIDDDGTLDLVTRLLGSDDLDVLWIGAYSGKDNQLLFKISLSNRDEYKRSRLFHHKRKLYLGHKSGEVVTIDLDSRALGANISLGGPLRDICINSNSLWFQTKNRKWALLDDTSATVSKEDRPKHCEALPDSESPVVSAGQIFGRGDHDGIKMEHVLELDGNKLLSYGSQSDTEIPSLALYLRGTRAAKAKGRRGDSLEFVWSLQLPRANKTTSRVPKRPLLAADKGLAAVGYTSNSISDSQPNTDISIVDLESGKTLYEISTDQRPHALKLAGDLLFSVSRREVKTYNIRDGSYSHTLGL